MVRRRQLDAGAGSSSDAGSAGRRWPKRVLFGTLGVLVVVAVVAAAGTAWGLWSFNQLDREDLKLSKVQDNTPQNFLVIGSDSRAGVKKGSKGSGVMLGKDTPSGQRSDSIAIMRIDPGKEQIDMLSIPRDLWVPIAGTGGEQRINTAYAHGTQTLIDTIQQDLGIPINHYVEVDLAGFQKLIEAIGGVPMYFPNPVKDNNSGLVVKNKGCTVLDGYMGLAFARSRHLQWSDGVKWHTDPTGDLGRMTRQQLLVRTALGQLKGLGLNDVGSLKGIVDAAVGSVKLDSQMGTGDIIDLSKRFADFDPAKLQTHSLPVVAHTTSGGAQVVLLDDAAAAPVLDTFRGTTQSTTTTTTEPLPSAGDVTVDVLNATGRQGEARRVSYVLVDGGFVAGAVAPSAEPSAVTIVKYPKGAKAMGELVAAWLGPAPELEEDPALGPGKVVVEIGANFKTVAKPDAAPAGSVAEPPAAVGHGTPAAAGSATSTPASTTTTEPGWSPGAAPSGVSCH